MGGGPGRGHEGEPEPRNMRPRRVGPERLGPEGDEPRNMGPQRQAPNCGTPQEGPLRWGPKGVGPQNFALFFHSPATIVFLSSLSWGSSRGILVVFLKAGASDVHDWAV